MWGNYLSVFTQLIFYGSFSSNLLLSFLNVSSLPILVIGIYKNIKYFLKFYINAIISLFATFAINIVIKSYSLDYKIKWTHFNCFPSNKLIIHYLLTPLKRYNIEFPSFQNCKFYCRENSYIFLILHMCHCFSRIYI